MKNKILLTAIMAFLGILTFSSVAEAHHGRGGHGRHKHVFNRFGNRTVVWHDNFGQCGNGWGYNNFVQNRMCLHMRNIWRGGRCGNAIVRCNSRGCGMFGNSFRNGRFFNNQRGYGNRYYNNRGFRGNGRYDRGGRRGNGGRYNQGGGRGNGGRYNQGGGRGNGGRYNQGGGRGNGRGNGGGTGRGNGRGNGRGGR